MREHPSYRARAMRQLSEAIALSRETARQGVALPKGSKRERELGEVATELGAMIQALGRDLGISDGDLVQMIQAPFQTAGKRLH